MIRWIDRVISWYDARRRQVDIDILWPECKRQAKSLEDARFVFYMHATNDPAWSRHFLHDELIKQIEALP